MKSIYKFHDEIVSTFYIRNWYWFIY